LHAATDAMKFDVFVNALTPIMDVRAIAAGWRRS